MAVSVGLTKKSDLALQSFAKMKKLYRLTKIGWNSKLFTFHHRCIQHIDVVCELVVIGIRDSSVQFDGAADHPIVF